MTKAKPIRQTKKLDALLRRYDVQLRTGTTTVVHPVTGETAHCDPLTFAVYESAIKSVFLSNALHPMWEELCEAGHDRHYLSIANTDGFDLPDPSQVPEKYREKRGKRAAMDYRYCVSLIAKAGLYFALLD